MYALLFDTEFAVKKPTIAFYNLLRLFSELRDAEARSIVRSNTVDAIFSRQPYDFCLMNSNTNNFKGILEFIQSRLVSSGIYWLVLSKNI